MGTRQSLEAAQIQKGEEMEWLAEERNTTICAAWYRKSPWLKGEIP